MVWVTKCKRYTHLGVCRFMVKMDQIPFSFLFIKISRNSIWSLLYSMVNCIEGLIEFKVSNNSSGQIWLLLKTVHGKTTNEWHTNDIRVHTSNTDGIRVHTSDRRMTYEWHTDDIRAHTNDIRVQTSDIRMTYEWQTDDIQFERKIKLIFLKLFDNSLSKYLICKRIPCMRYLFWVIYQN